MPKVIAIDTETTGLDIVKGCKPFSVYTFDDQGEHRWWVWDVDPKTRQPIVPRRDVREITELLCESERVVMHNYSFDLRALESIGVTWDWVGKVHDTGVMGHVLRSDKTQLVRGKLKEMAVVFLQYSKDDEKDLQKITTAARRAAKKLEWNLAADVAADYWMPRQIAIEQQRPEDDPWMNVCDTYGRGDVERTLGLYLHFVDGLHQEGLWDVYLKEQELFPVIHNMMKRGIAVSIRRIKAEILEREMRIKESSEKMRRILKDSKFNPASTRDLQIALFDKLRFTPTKMNKTGPSTDKSVIATLHLSAEKEGNSLADRKRVKFLDALHIYRKAATSRGYLKEYEKEQYHGRMYYSLKQNGTSTTRFSSSKPNAQNVGKGEDAVDEDGNAIVVDSLRRVFGPPKGRLWLAMDYSQLQLRIFAYLSKEKQLIKSFEDGWDAHDYMAHRIFQLPADVKPTKFQRRVGKAVNFGYIFGASPEKIELTAGVPGLWSTVTRMFSIAYQYMEKTKQEVRRNRYITTVTGYRLYLPYRDGSIATHAGVNYQVQGCEGLLVKDAMIRNHRYLESLKKWFEPGEEAFITLQVHDEIIYDLPSNLEESLLVRIARKLKKNMEAAGTAIGMKTPVDAEIIRVSWDRGEHFEC